MKLSNRFPSKVKEFWIGWYVCLSCMRSHSNCLHHIMSPSSIDYVKGKHNESIYNSCPLNNEECHLYKPLHNFNKQKELLLKVKSIIDISDYKIDDNDKKFLEVYKKYYKNG